MFTTRPPSIPKFFVQEVRTLAVPPLPPVWKRPWWFVPAWIVDHRCFTLIHFHELLDSLVYSHSSERGKKQIIRLERLIQSQFLLARFKGGAFWRAFLDQDNRCNLLKKIFLSSLRSLPFGVSYFFFFPNSWRFVRHHLVIESENRFCRKSQWKKYYFVSIK